MCEHTGLCLHGLATDHYEVYVRCIHGLACDRKNVVCIHGLACDHMEVQKRYSGAQHIVTGHRGSRTKFSEPGLQIVVKSDRFGPRGGRWIQCGVCVEPPTSFVFIFEAAPGSPPRFVIISTGRTSRWISASCPGHCFLKQGGNGHVLTPSSRTEGSEPGLHIIVKSDRFGPRGGRWVQCGVCVEPPTSFGCVFEFAPGSFPRFVIMSSGKTSLRMSGACPGHRCKGIHLSYRGRRARV